MKIISVVGARPNFMKIAPFIRAVEAYNKTNAAGIEHLLVHTGQHYDDKMSSAFFKALDIPDADINLDVGSGTHAQQVGQTMMAFEKVVQAEKPDWVVVVGDVNATLACSVTAKKEWVRCCHIEAGLRSGDMTMPEEVNRLVTDRLSDLLLTPDLLSSENLRKEGVAEEKIKFVGNIMIDTLEAQRSRAEELSIQAIIQKNLIPGQPIHLSLTAQGSPLYALMTLHRPSNVDHPDVFAGIFEFLLKEVAEDMPLFWPVHPRARQKMEEFGLWQRALVCPGLVLLEPLGYHDMLRLNMDARIMLTDSGGLQEECTVLGTPCLTLRWNTERPVTLREHGVQRAGREQCGPYSRGVQNTLSSERRPVRPELWDGKAAERCLKAILEY